MDHGHASLKSHKRKSKNRIDIRNLDFFQKIESKSIVFGNFKIVHHYKQVKAAVVNITNRINELVR